MKWKALILIGFLLVLIVNSVNALPGEHNAGANTLLLLHFNGTNGGQEEITDNSTQGRNFAFAGTSRYTENGKYGSAFWGDGSDSDAYYAYTHGTGLNFTTGSVTVEAWVNLNQTPTDYCVVEGTGQYCGMGIVMASSGNNFRLMFDDNGGIQTRWENETGHVSTWMTNNPDLSWDDFDWETNKWYHIAVTYENVSNEDFGIVRWYLDGKLLEKRNADIKGGQASVNGTLQIGDYTAGTSGMSGFNGTIDEVRITDGVLKPPQFSNFRPEVSDVNIYPYPFYAKPTEKVWCGGRYGDFNNNNEYEKNSTITYFRERSGTTEKIYTQNSWNNTIFYVSFDINDTAPQSVQNLKLSTYTYTYKDAGLHYGTDDVNYSLISLGKYPQSIDINRANFTRIHRGKYYESLNMTHNANSGGGIPVSYSDDFGMTWNGTHPFSISAWFTRHESAANNNLITKYYYTPRGNRFWTLAIGTGNNVKFTLYHSNGTSSSNVTQSHTSTSPALSKDRLYFIVAVWNGTHTFTYLDGVLHDSDRCSQDSDGDCFPIGATPDERSARIAIGSTTDTDNPWNGTIDEVAIWNRTLGLQEIQELYNRTQRLGGQQVMLNGSYYQDLDNLTCQYCPGNGIIDYDEGQGTCVNSSTLQIKDYTVEHPYLFFNKSGLHSLQQRVTGGEYKLLYDDLEKQRSDADGTGASCSYLATRINNTASAYYVSGRVNWEHCSKESDVWGDNLCAENLFHMQNLAFCTAITGNEIYLNATKYWMDVAASWRDRDDYQKLQTAYGIQNLVIGYDWIYPNLTDYERRKYRDAFIEEIQEINDNWLYPRGGNAELDSTEISNWDGILTGATHLGILAIMNETSIYEKEYNHSLTHLNYYIDYMYNSSGNHQEGGLPYFEYASLGLYPAIEAETNINNNTFWSRNNNVLNKTIDWTIWMSRIPDMKFPSFGNPSRNIALGWGDSGYNTLSYAWTPLYSLKNHNNPLAYWLYYNITRDVNSTSINAQPFEIILYKEPSQYITPNDYYEEKAKYFDDFKQMVIMRNGFESKDDFILGFKTGGRWNDKQQPEAGNILLWSYNTQWFDYPGKGNTNAYDGDDWTYYADEGVSHNIIMDYYQGPFNDALDRELNPWMGEATFFSTSDEYSFATANVKNAYDENGVNVTTAERNVLTVWNGNQPYVIVIDDFLKDDSSVRNWTQLWHSNQSNYRNYGVLHQVGDAGNFTMNHTKTVMMIRNVGLNNMVYGIVNKTLPEKVNSTYVNLDYLVIATGINRSRGSFFTLLYPLNKSNQNFPVINNIVRNNLLGIKVGNDYTIWNNATTRTTITFNNVKTDAEIISWTNNSDGDITKIFTKNMTSFELTDTDLDITIKSDWEGRDVVYATHLENFNVTFTGNKTQIRDNVQTKDNFIYVLSTDDNEGGALPIKKQSSVYFTSSSTNTEKRIASNLTETINATVSIDTGNCDVELLNYRSNDEKYDYDILTTGVTNYSCYEGVVTILNLREIQPADSSNRIAIDYSAAEGSGGGAASSDAVIPTTDKKCPFGYHLDGDYCIPNELSASNLLENIRQIPSKIKDTLEEIINNPKQGFRDNLPYILLVGFVAFFGVMEIFNKKNILQNALLIVAALLIILNIAAIITFIEGIYPQNIAVTLVIFGVLIYLLWDVIKEMFIKK